MKKIKLVETKHNSLIKSIILKENPRGLQGHWEKARDFSERVGCKPKRS